MRWDGLRSRKVTTYVVWVEFVTYPGAVKRTESVASGTTKAEAQRDFKNWIRKNLPRLEKWRDYMISHSGVFVKYWVEEHSVALKERGVIP